MFAYHTIRENRRLHTTHNLLINRLLRHLPTEKLEPRVYVDDAAVVVVAAVAASSAAAATVSAIALAANTQLLVTVKQR